jgi:hypothetical protein
MDILAVIGVFLLGASAGAILTKILYSGLTRKLRSEIEPHTSR